MQHRFRNRHDAGRALANLLLEYSGRRDVTVVGIARGGVPVAFEVAQRLRLPLEVLIVQQITKPGEPERTIGAVASGGVLMLDERETAGAPIREIQNAIERGDKELEAQSISYFNADRMPKIAQQLALLVDDGLTACACLTAAVEALSKYGSSSIVLASPVTADAICERTRRGIQKLVTLTHPTPVEELRECYDDVSPTLDEEVVELLQEHAASVHLGMR